MTELAILLDVTVDDRQAIEVIRACTEALENPGRPVILPPGAHLEVTPSPSGPAARPSVAVIRTLTVTGSDGVTREVRR